MKYVDFQNPTLSAIPQLDALVPRLLRFSQRNQYPVDCALRDICQMHNFPGTESESLMTDHLPNTSRPCDAPMHAAGES